MGVLDKKITIANNLLIEYVNLFLIKKYWYLVSVTIINIVFIIIRQKV
jgi:hypothetical protein